MHSSDSRSATPAQLHALALRQKNGGAMIAKDFARDNSCQHLLPSNGTGVKSFGLPLHNIRITSEFGPRTHPVRGTRHSHSGVDLAAPAGTPVFAAANGIIGFVGTKPAIGKYVMIQHANGYATYYGHLSAFAPDLKIGSPDTRGERIGAVGSTGTATGPHLHFEVRMNNGPVNPMALIEKPHSRASLMTASASHGHPAAMSSLVARSSGTCSYG
ncbi:M23 family metallopeptidase [Paraburkholderia fungorum]|uniref:M23 family metallopeptidase n=1 Tax=Paraburkholderia fungorum TaxID=134537 RepID=UPI00209B20DC|nr:M23 family metallopeptidase [Paraburkholderia fungorum]